MSDYNSATKALSAQLREKVLLAASKKGLSESDPMWGLLTAQCEMIEGFLDRIGAVGTNGQQLPAVQGDHLVHFNEMASAFERLTALVQAQQKALVKLAESDDKIFRKVNLFVEGQPQYQLAKWFWWATGLCAVLALSGTFIAGMLYNSRQADARVDHIIALQPSGAIASAALASHGGSISIAPISRPDGKEARGIVVRRGDLKQDAALDGAILLTLP